jgi:preprotein translocase subunit YajC
LRLFRIAASAAALKPGAFAVAPAHSRTRRTADDFDLIGDMMLDLLAAGAAGSAPPGWVQFLPIVGMILIFWFLIIRPQMRQQKAHREKVAGVKKGDTVVTAGGLLGKVIKVDEQYVELEIAQGVKVKAVKATLGDIVPPGGKPAND